MNQTRSGTGEHRQKRQEEKKKKRGPKKRAVNNELLNYVENPEENYLTMAAIAEQWG